MQGKTTNHGYEILIQPSTNDPVKFRLRELIEARYLLWNLIKRNVKLPYVDFTFGFLWSLARPVLFVLVVVFIKKRSASNMQVHINYVLFVYSGIIIYWYFTRAVVGATQSIFKDSGLLTKVYYPRIVTPVVPVVAGLSDLLVQMLLLPIGMVLYSQYPGWYFFLLPIVLLQVMILSLGAGLLVAVLAMESRDYVKILDNILYIGFFMSPVIYSVTLIPEPYRLAYMLLNPVAAPLEMFRYVLFGGGAIPWGLWALTWGVTLLICFAGLTSFWRVERFLAERVL
jgi:lipopolysaccharide transport system permease protein